MTYNFLQHYWSFIGALFCALLVLLLFVQGVNAMVHSLCYTEKSRQVIYDSTKCKWALTTTTLIVLCGLFFAAFPKFYSASFCGAYWLWAVSFSTFALQAVGYMLMDRVKNPGVFRFFLTLNGYLGPMLIGCVMATLFEGADFIFDKEGAPITNASHGLDALANPLVLIFSVSVFFLARLLGVLYLRKSITDEDILSTSYGRLIAATIHFVVLFMIFFVHLLLFKDGYAYDDGGLVTIEPNKYLTNFLDMWYLALILLIGMVLVVFSALKSIFHKTYTGGFWPAAIGAGLITMALMLSAMWNHTAYYPSTTAMQSSLTIANSCNSEATLRTMFYASLLIPVAIAYAVYRWRAADRKEAA